MSLIRRLANDHMEDTEESVARNLEVVLNAKKGYSAAVDVYGLGDYDIQLASKPLVAALLREMTEAIRKFEPRLRKPQLTVSGRDGSMWVRMQLLGELSERRVGYLVRFHVVLRNVRVEQLRSEHTNDEASEQQRTGPRKRPGS